MKNVDTSEVRKSKSVFILFYKSMTEASWCLLWSCEYDLDQNNEYVVRIVSYPHFNCYRKQKVIYNVIWLRCIALCIYPTIDWSNNVWYIYHFKVNPLLVKFNPLRCLYNIIYLRFFTNKYWCYIHSIEHSLTKINSICLVLLCVLVYFIARAFWILYF